jgi:hypothetical protein
MIEKRMEDELQNSKSKKFAFYFITKVLKNNLSDATINRFRMLSQNPD